MWWPDVGRLVDEEAVARAERGDDACCRAHEEAAGQASMRRWQLAKQGGTQVSKEAVAGVCVQEAWR
jgi:hypothetical protein